MSQQQVQTSQDYSSDKCTDWLDQAADIESEWITSGEKDGHRDAIKASSQHGKKLGFEYGQDIGEEVGFYIGILLSFTFNLLQDYYLHINNGSIENHNSESISYSPPWHTIQDIEHYTEETYNKNILTLKEYNKNYFEALLPNSKTPTVFQQEVMTRFKWSFLKYKGVIQEIIVLLSTSQAIQGVPGDNGDVHHITDLRTRMKALFARLGVNHLFKDEKLLEM